MRVHEQMTAQELEEEQARIIAEAEEARRREWEMDEAINTYLFFHPEWHADAVSDYDFFHPEQRSKWIGAAS